MIQKCQNQIQQIVKAEQAGATGGTWNGSEINKRLQALLEDTLLKNIQLQNEMENLSEQVVRLSKTTSSNTNEQKVA